MLSFDASNPTEKYSIAAINGLQLYVVKCDDCDALIPKCMTCEHTRMHLNGPQPDNSEEFCYYYDDLRKKYEPGDFDKLLGKIFNKFGKRKESSTRSNIQSDTNLELVLTLTKNMPSNHQNCCFLSEDCEPKLKKQFENVMYRNKRIIKNWVTDNHKKESYNGKPLSIMFPLVKVETSQKKTRKRGVSSLPTETILPSKRRSETTENLQNNNEIASLKLTLRAVQSQNRKLNDQIRRMKLLLEQNDIEFNESDPEEDDDLYQDDSVFSGKRLRIEPCDTFYLNKGKFLLASERRGNMKLCSVDLMKRSLTLQIDGNLNSTQLEFLFRDFKNNLGLFPKGDLFSVEFFRSHKELLPILNEYVLANRLKNGAEFSIYFDGSPSLKKKNLISYGFFDENCESFNLGITQFEHNRADKEKKSSVEAKFILDHIKRICEKYQLDLVTTLSKIKSSISDNAHAAQSCQKHLLNLLREMAPIQGGRIGIGCSAHLVALLEKWILELLKIEPQLRKISGYLGNENGQESAAELWQDLKSKYKFKYIKGSRWGVLAFNSGVVFLESDKLKQLLERRKALDSTAAQILEFMENRKTMNNIAIMAFCFGICKIFWKCLIKKQSKRDLIHRLTTITTYQNDMKNLSINGEDIELSQISRKTDKLREDLEINRPIALDQVIARINGKENDFLQANSDFQRRIDKKFANFISNLDRTEQVEVLMQTASCIRESLENMLGYFKGWFEFNHDNLDQLIVPSNLEVERRLF